MQTAVMDMAPFTDFGKACRAVLDFLSERFDFDLWMMTRTEGDDWIILQTKDNSYDVAAGNVLPWGDSVCSRMVAGDGPRIAPDLSRIQTYAGAPIAQRLNIGAYVGVPILRDDGSLFGTLCAVDPTPKDESVAGELGMLELLGQLLGSILSTELRAVEQARLAALSQKDAVTDMLTGVLNRRGWETVVDTEEKRSRRYGSPACVMIIDLDDLKEVNDTRGHEAGDSLIRAAADALLDAVRESDSVARLGGDEFAILAVEIDPAGARVLEHKVRAALAEGGIKASVGVASRNPGLGLEHAIAEADRLMYREKAGH